jgi:uncharacterized membrane protein YcaP (DUF421 family)
MDWIFDGWAGVGRTVLVGLLAYAALVAVLRTTGKRTLAKLNAFDLVVTVALGSTLATILLSADVALAEGVAAFALLAALQWAVARAALASGAVRGAVKSTPRALLRDGRPDEAALREERVTGDELAAAVRAAGLGSIEGAAWVVLETDGTLSVIARAQAGDGSALRGVRGSGVSPSTPSLPP